MVKKGRLRERSKEREAKEKSQLSPKHDETKENAIQKGHAFPNGIFFIVVSNASQASVLKGSPLSPRSSSYFFVTSTLFVASLSTLRLST